MAKRKTNTNPASCALVQVLGTSVQPGQNITLDMQMAKLYTRTNVEIPVVVDRAKVEGPTLLIMAGVHGDEVSGIDVVRRMLKMVRERPLDKGTLIAIPVLNVFGFLAMRRELPDGRDMNRFFPGRAKGSLASRIAHALVHEVLPAADLVFDIHAGGAQRLNYPQVRYTEGNAKALELSHLVDPPVILRSKVIKGTLRAHMESIQRPYLLFESGASAQFDDLTIQEGCRAVTRIMEGIGLWQENTQAKRGAIEYTSSKWVRANNSGLLQLYVENGAIVEQGTILASINDPYGSTLSRVRSPLAGRIICVNTAPVVNQGDALFHVAI